MEVSDGLYDYYGVAVVVHTWCTSLVQLVQKEGLKQGVLVP